MMSPSRIKGSVNLSPDMIRIARLLANRAVRSSPQRVERRLRFRESGCAPAKPTASRCGLSPHPIEHPRPFSYNPRPAMNQAAPTVTADRTNTPLLLPALSLARRELVRFLRQRNRIIGALA